MGDYTTGNFFYKPAIGAAGTAEKTLFDDALDATDAVLSGLGDAATKNTGTTSGTVAAGNDSRFAAFPIGSVFLAVVSTNPGTLLGYGTWAAFGAGKMLVGLNSGDADFDTAEETGGAKTHTLSVNNLPAHSHGVTDPGHSHTVDAAPVNPALSCQPLAVGGNWVGGVSSSSNTTGISIGDTGTGTAVTHMNPYIVVYMWKRTA